MMRLSARTSLKVTSTEVRSETACLFGNLIQIIPIDRGIVRIEMKPFDSCGTVCQFTTMKRGKGATSIC